MDFTQKTIAELEERKAQMANEVNNADANLDELEAEARAIKAELEAREAKAKEDAEQRAKVAQGAIETKQIEERKETTKMQNVEIRNTEAYLNAFANYIKSGDDKECRALLTENVSGGTVPVPELVYEEIMHAWENNDITRRLKKTFLKGNVKVGFEISASGAVKHTEGSAAVSAQDLQLGIVNIIPSHIKKLVEVSDEALALNGENFLKYIYSELTYHIAKKVADEVIAAIEACGTTSTTTSVAVPKVKTTAAVGAVAQGMALLSDEAQRPVVMMNKATWGAFKTAQYAANFAADIFEGLDVVFNNTIKAYSVATTGETFAIVGDLGQGAMANFPNGEDISFIFDDKTLAAQDLVRVIGKEYVGLGIVAPSAFVKLVK